MDEKPRRAWGRIALWALALFGAVHVPRYLIGEVDRLRERWTATSVDGEWTIEIQREAIGPDARMTISNGREEHVYVWREYEPDHDALSE